MDLPLMIREIFGGNASNYTRQYKWRSKRVLQIWFWRTTPQYMLLSGIKDWTESPFYKLERSYWIANFEAHATEDIFASTCYPAKDWINYSFHLPQSFERPYKFIDHPYRDDTPYTIHHTPFATLVLPSKYDVNT